jgi:hypothetical protein
MTALSFRSISMAAGVAGAALGCYMVSLRVAAERVTLERAETQIVLAQRDIRVLQTEIGTRGRLAQLEKWNAKVLALSAPEANQFLQGSFQLATLARPHDKIVDPGAPVVLAAAPAPQRAPSDMMHVASYKAETRQQSAPEAPQKITAPAKKAVEKPAPKPATQGAAVASGDKAKAAAKAPAKAVAVKAAAKTSASTPKTSAATPTKPKPTLKAAATAPASTAKDLKAKK